MNGDDFPAADVGVILEVEQTVNMVMWHGQSEIGERGSRTRRAKSPILSPVYKSRRKESGPRLGWRTGLRGSQGYKRFTRLRVVNASLYLALGPGWPWGDLGEPRPGRCRTLPSNVMVWYEDDGTVSLYSSLAA